MKIQFVALAISVLALALAPLDAGAQGRSGKQRVTICHVPPGNPDARRTKEVPESALPAHEGHGDTLGPCDGYAGDRNAKKSGKRKRGDADYEDGYEGASDDDVADSDAGAVDESDRRTKREERRARRAREQADEATDPGQGGDVADSDAGAVDESDRRTKREERRARRAREGTEEATADGTGRDAAPAGEAAEVSGEGESPSDAGQSDEADRRDARRADRRGREDRARADLGEEAQEEGGFMADVKRFFGFGEGEGEGEGDD